MSKGSDFIRMCSTFLTPAFAVSRKLKFVKFVYHLVAFLSTVFYGIDLKNCLSLSKMVPRVEFATVSHVKHKSGGFTGSTLD